jgi:hypothetical protein
MDWMPAALKWHQGAMSRSRFTALFDQEKEAGCCCLLNLAAMLSTLDWQP